MSKAINFSLVIMLMIFVVLSIFQDTCKGLSDDCPLATSLCQEFNPRPTSVRTTLQTTNFALDLLLKLHILQI